MLSERGPVEFRVNVADGRSKLVFLTEQGRALREVAHQALAPPYARLIENIDAADLAAGLPALQRIRMRLDEERGASP